MQIFFIWIKFRYISIFLSIGPKAKVSNHEHYWNLTMDETIAAEVISCLKTFFGDILQNCNKKVTINESVLLTGELCILFDNNETSKVFVHERMRKIEQSGNFACVSGSHSVKCRSPPASKQTSILPKKEIRSHLMEVKTENDSNLPPNPPKNDENYIDIKPEEFHNKFLPQRLILNVQGDESLTFDIDTSINSDLKQIIDDFPTSSEDAVVLLKQDHVQGVPSDHSLHIAINEKLDNAVTKSDADSKVTDDLMKFVTDVNEAALSDNEDVSMMNDSLAEEQSSDRTPHKRKKKKYCDECKQGFYKHETLMRHKMIHHAGLHPYTCGVCNKGFNNKYSFEDHRLRHADTQAYQCSDCGKCFKTSQDLKQHVRIIHVLKKSQVCSIKSEAIFENVFGI